MLFTAVSDAPAYCIPTIGDVNFISRPSQKFPSDNSSVLQILYNLPLSAASEVALNEHHRFLFLHNLKTKCVNMAVMYVSYVLKLKLWLRNNPVSKSIIMQLGHRHCLSTIAFILDIYLWCLNMWIYCDG